MHFTLFASIAITLYLAATALIIKTSGQTSPPTNSSIFNGFGLAWIALVCHALAISQVILSVNGFNVGFFSMTALVVWVVTVTVLASTFTKPVDKLALLILPLAALSLALQAANPDEAHWLNDLSFSMKLHVLISIIAFSLLNIAALQALLLAYQDHQLRHHHQNWFIHSLPPLQTMESLLFQMITTGFIFLTVSLLSGFLFIHDLFAQHLAHKTVLSILAWFIFAALLGGRFRYGWRGQTAIRWTLWGFAALMLAYFGTKLVLQLILNRSA